MPVALQPTGINISLVLILATLLALICTHVQFVQMALSPCGRLQIFYIPARKLSVRTVRLFVCTARLRRLQMSLRLDNCSCVILPTTILGLVLEDDDVLYLKYVHALFEFMIQSVGRFDYCFPKAKKTLSFDKVS